MKQRHADVLSVMYAVAVALGSAKELVVARCIQARCSLLTITPFLQHHSLNSQTKYKRCVRPPPHCKALATFSFSFKA